MQWYVRRLDISWLWQLLDAEAVCDYLIGTAKEWGNLLPVVRDAYAAAFAI